MSWTVYMCHTFKSWSIDWLPSITFTFWRNIWKIERWQRQCKYTTVYLILILDFTIMCWLLRVISQSEEALGVTVSKQLCGSNCGGSSRCPLLISRTGQRWVRYTQKMISFNCNPTSTVNHNHNPRCTVASFTSISKLIIFYFPFSQVACVYPMWRCI